MTNRVLIVDDEAPARSKVIHFLQKCEPDAQIHEASNGKDAVTMIESNAYDVVFLDIQMPEMTGFEVVYNIGVEHMPHYVFATAYDAYAIQAFEAHAMDYLLKPFTFDRFQQSYRRLQKQINQLPTNVGNSVQSLMRQLQTHDNRPMRLTVRQDGKIRLIDPDDIIFVESDEHYLRYHLRTEQLYERGSLKDLLTKLDPARFQQIHRSTLVNLRFIKEIEPITHGDYCTLLNTGHRLTISRRFTQNLGL